MTDIEIIEQFEKSWFYNRQITMDFFEAVPAEKWDYSHHPKYATLAKQFSHMVRVYGVYIDGFLNQSVDFSKKPEHYSGPLLKDPIREAFKTMDARYKDTFEVLKQRGISDFRLSFFGVNMSFTEYTHIIIQHECMHIGMWSTYAAFGEFELPDSWKNEWGF
jgi:uncharacterized damage-inducible protein DinB